ncbi:hypothetical protein BDF14DRAFT_1739645 [Spinellus fusiger]|nr:hypothetical protein BDF14DRAFT_1739645 [Spinellus fusiger]
MFDSHSPLTPPAETAHDDLLIELKGARKPSVTFDLCHLPVKEPFILSPTDNASPTDNTSPPVAVDLAAHSVPNSILVALLDRDKEMRGLVQHNRQFFDSLKLHLPNWSCFENTLYCHRSQLNDKDWMDHIGSALRAMPPTLDRFKALVGYIEESTPLKVDQEAYSESPFEQVDIVSLRNYPSRLERFPQSYPQFFINCQQALGEATSQYRSFQTTLFAPRNEIADALWEKSLYDQLDAFPNLMDQLKEIIAYEAQDEDDEEIA